MMIAIMNDNDNGNDKEKNETDVVVRLCCSAKNGRA